MVLLISVLYTLLAFLGFRDHSDSPTTELAGRVSCRGLQVRDGRVSCSNDGYQTVCKVICDRKAQGVFTCSEDEGWYPKLPTCARPMEDEQSSSPLDGGCPDDAKCDLACREDPRFGTKGSCVGPHKLFCTCEPANHAIQQPMNVAAMACDDMECTFSCMGKCINGNCVCGE